jgi:iron(III) transport system substrate-binding protein
MASHVPFLMLVGALLVACAGPPASGTSSAPRAAATAPAAPSGSAPDYATPFWQELAAAARAEGTLVLSSSPTQATRQNLPRAFKERFGVDVEYLGGRSAELVTRVENERAAGMYTIDVHLGGGDSIAGMYQNGWLAPVRPHLAAPEVLDPTVWRGGRLPFLDPDDSYLLELEGSVAPLGAFNTQLVSANEVQTFDDLLNPKWKGKLTIEEATVAGSGQNRAIYIYAYKGEEYFKRLFVDQQPTFSRDARQMADWLARGTYPLSLALNANDLEPLERDGLPVELLGTLDGPGYVVGGFSVLGLYSNAPHPNAARLFLNWIASPEGLRVHAEAEQQAPSRKDVPAPWLRDFQIPKDGVNYMHLYNYQYVTEQKPAILRRFREILGS